MILHIPNYFYGILVFLTLQACNKSNKSDTQIDFCKNIHRNDSMSLSKALEPVKANMIHKTGVYVLEDGDGAMVTRAWLSEYAENTIDVQYFIFSTDNVGLIACDYLVRAADRGVKVRILVDDIMVEASGEEILTMDSHKNISVKVYNPGVNLGKNILKKLYKYSTDFKSANQRMHNKSFIVDGKVAITGGRNVADEYFDYNHDYNFRDRDVLLLGKVTKVMLSSFNDFWNSPLSVSVSKLVDDKIKQDETDIKFQKLHQYACNPENFWPQVRDKIQKLPLAFKAIQESGDLVWLDSVFFVTDYPGKNDGKKGLNGGGVSTNALIKLIQEAKHSVDIQSPYLITTELGRNLFSDAVKRGVKVRILTNSLGSTDNLEAFGGYQKGRESLLKTGVRVFEFRPDSKERYKLMTGALQKEIEYKPVFGLHAKSMVVDGKITVIGTFNLDPRSANLNTECFAVIHSEKVSRGVLNGMEEEFKPENSWETTLKFNPDSKSGNLKRIKTFPRKILPKAIL